MHSDKVNTMMDFLPMLIGCLMVLAMGVVLFVMVYRAERSDDRTHKP